MNSLSALNSSSNINVLQVKFNSDTIDETDLLEEMLKFRVESIDGILEKVNLSGNHITPCLQVNQIFLYFVSIAIDLKKPLLLMYIHWHSERALIELSQLLHIMHVNTVLLHVLVVRSFIY